MDYCGLNEFCAVYTMVYGGLSEFCAVFAMVYGGFNEFCPVFQWIIVVSMSSVQFFNGLWWCHSVLCSFCKGLL